MTVNLNKSTDNPTVRITRVTFLEDEVFDGGIPMACIDNARTEDFEADRADDSTDEIIDYAVRVLQREGLSFAATGSDYACNPDGSRITDYATAEREETSAHLYGFTDAEREAIIERVG
jgi:hypothetical protein